MLLSSLVLHRTVIRHMADIDAASVTVVSGTESFPGTAGLRPLTTKYIYASSCITRWYQPYPDSSSWYTSLVSTYGRGNYFASCQPSDGTSSLQLRYSPGVCPSGQTIATITESRTVPVAEDGSGRVWLAYCCLRYVNCVKRLAEATALPVILRWVKTS